MSKHITREVWAAAGDFYKAAQPGDTVDEQIVNDFRDCVPPASMSSGYLQVGEAYDPSMPAHHSAACPWMA